MHDSMKELKESAMWIPIKFGQVVWLFYLKHSAEE